MNGAGAPLRTLGAFAVETCFGHPGSAGLPVQASFEDVAGRFFTLTLIDDFAGGAADDNAGGAEQPPGARATPRLPSLAAAKPPLAAADYAGPSSGPSPPETIALALAGEGQPSGDTLTQPPGRKPPTSPRAAPATTASRLHRSKTVIVAHKRGDLNGSIEESCWP